MALSAAVPASANIVINPTFDSSITNDSDASAIESTILSAIGFYENTLQDPITVSITFSEMSSGLGRSQWYAYKIPYTTFRSALAADAKTAVDAEVMNNLPLTDPIGTSGNVIVHTANLRAVGLTGYAAPGGTDGTVSLNTQITDIGSAGTTGQYSLFATTEHEIDEILGFGSSAGNSGGFFTDPQPQDLFRYDASGARSFTGDPTALAYFSIDGSTDLAQFDNQNDGGDKADWQSDPRQAGVAPKVQDAFATPYAHPVLTTDSPEVVSLDAIGYDVLQPPVPTPEPTSLLLFGLSVAAVGVIRAHSKRA